MIVSAPRCRFCDGYLRLSCLPALNPFESLSGLLTSYVAMRYLSKTAGEGEKKVSIHILCKVFEGLTSNKEIKSSAVTVIASARAERVIETIGWSRPWRLGGEGTVLRDLCMDVLQMRPALRNSRQAKH